MLSRKCKLLIIINKKHNHNVDKLSIKYLILNLMEIIIQLLKKNGQ